MLRCGVEENSDPELSWMIKHAASADFETKTVSSDVTLKERIVVPSGMARRDRLARVVSKAVPLLALALLVKVAGGSSCRRYLPRGTA